MGNTPLSSPPLGLPLPPIDIVGEVALEEASSEYEDISSSFSPHTPKARLSFLKDKAVSLLFGATVQTYFGPVYISTAQQQGGDLDDIVHVGTPEGVSVSRSVDLLSLFQSLGQSDGGPSSSAFFSMAPLGNKAVGFLSGATPDQDIFEDATTVSESISDDFATQTEDRGNEFVGDMDVGELIRDTSNNYASTFGGLTKWINRFLLASGNDNRDGFCMKVNEATGYW